MSPGGRTSRPTSWQLVLDPAACDGHGICALLFAERIGLDEWGSAAVRGGPFSGRVMLRRARRAVAACPAAALRLAVVPSAAPARPTAGAAPAGAHEQPQ